MRIVEECICGAKCEAEDEKLYTSKRNTDGSGTGYAADFVERWRTNHLCTPPLSTDDAALALAHGEVEA